MDAIFAQNLRGIFKTKPPARTRPRSECQDEKPIESQPAPVPPVPASEEAGSNATQPPTISSDSEESEEESEDPEQEWLESLPLYSRFIELGLEDQDIKRMFCHPSVLKGKGEDYRITASDVRDVFVAAYDVDDEGGQHLSDRPGWHDFVSVPPGQQVTVRMHDDTPGDRKWHEKFVGKFPLGLRGPEDFIWGDTPEDLFHMEPIEGGYIRACCSASQLFACGDAPPPWNQRKIKLITVEKDSWDASKDKSKKENTSSTDMEMIKLLCGEPKPIPELNHSGFTYQDRPVDLLDIRMSRDNLPLVLDIYDPDGVLSHVEEGEDSGVDSGNESIEYGPNFDRRKPASRLPIPEETKPLRYKLHDPSGTYDPAKREEWQSKTTATLILSKSRRLGRGNSAIVYEGQINFGCEPLERINPDPKSKDYTSVRQLYFPDRLRVVVKVAVDVDGAGHRFVRNEAKTYNLFPDFFSQEYNGFQYVPGVHLPQRICKIVPNFYGYYLPVDDPEEASDISVSGKTSRPKLLPILLLEDCGEPIDPNKLTQYQKMEIFGMYTRMHNAGFHQNSSYARNILWQPGPESRRTPLCRIPPFLREKDKPSFRIIDFGRYTQRDDEATALFDGNAEAEMRRLYQVIQLQRFGYEGFSRNMF